MPFFHFCADVRAEPRETLLCPAIGLVCNVLLSIHQSWDCMICDFRLKNVVSGFCDVQRRDRLRDRN